MVYVAVESGIDDITPFITKISERLKGQWISATFYKGGMHHSYNEEATA